MNKNIHPAGDGTTHINIYSGAKTALGRRLSNFAPFIQTLGGHTYGSVEAYWFAVGLQLPEHERARLAPLSGLEAKRAGQELRRRYPRHMRDDFEAVIGAAIEDKVRRMPGLASELAASTLPLTHYYVQSGVARDGGTAWIVTFIEQLRTRLQAEQTRSQGGNATAPASPAPTSPAPSAHREGMPSPGVVNMRHARNTPGVQYVGRQCAGLSGSPLGNPFPVRGKARWTAASEAAAALVEAQGSPEAAEKARHLRANGGGEAGQTIEVYRAWLKLTLIHDQRGPVARELSRLARRHREQLTAGQGPLQLGCWCAPSPCHADVVASAAGWLAGQQMKKT